MDAKTLLAIAVAGVFAASSSAWAGGASKHRSSEVQAPASVSDANPSHPDSAFGSTSGMSASGSIEVDSSMSTSAGTEYWRIGEESSQAGSTSGAGASGSLGLDVSTSSSESSE